MILLGHSSVPALAQAEAFEMERYFPGALSEARVNLASYAMPLDLGISTPSHERLSPFNRPVLGSILGNRLVNTSNHLPHPEDGGHDGHTGYDFW